MGEYRLTLQDADLDPRVIGDPDTPPLLEVPRAAELRTDREAGRRYACAELCGSRSCRHQFFEPEPRRGDDSGIGVGRIGLRAEPGDTGLIVGNGEFPDRLRSVAAAERGDVRVHNRINARGLHRVGSPEPPELLGYQSFDDVLGWRR